jgi:hypothetical protein
MAARSPGATSTEVRGAGRRGDADRGQGVSRPHEGCHRQHRGTVTASRGRQARGPALIVGIERSGDREEPSDVSGTLVRSERAHAPVVDRAVGRALLVFAGAPVRTAGSATIRVRHASGRWRIPVGRQRRRQRRGRRLGQRLRWQRQCRLLVLRDGLGGAALHPGIEGHPGHARQRVGRAERPGQGRHPARVRGVLPGRRR